MEKYYWLNNDSRKFLSEGYLLEGQTAEERIRIIAETAERYLGIKGFADKFEDYMARGWISLASPIWSNYGTDRGLPISCNGSYIPDTMEGILYKTAEVGMMSKLGAGTSVFFGDVRARGSTISTGGTSDGPVHFMELIDTTTNVVSQSNVRRGSCAAYLPVEHPDIKEFLEIREEGNRIQKLSIGVTITNKWMEEMIAGDKDKRKIWARIVKKRFETGYPYLFFHDNVNDNAPQVYKDKGHVIHASNLCLTGDTIIDIGKEYPYKLKIRLDGFVKEYFVNNPDNSYVYTNDGYKKVTAAALTGYFDELIEITYLDYINQTAHIKCTPDHKIFANNEWIEAKNIKIGDILVADFGDNRNTKVVNVATIKYEEPVPVYDITVPETESFFANDILVHNCSEIALSYGNTTTNNLDDLQSFVCCLSSVNVLHYDEWKDTDLIETMIYFLDSVMTEYIKKTENVLFMNHAHTFAKQQRALGLGILGWHSLLQSKMIAFEGEEARNLTLEMSKLIQERSDKATIELAKLFGEPELLIGYGRRNVTTLAIAPTTSSSFILGQVSPSVEPLNSNYFVKDLAKGKFTYKNPYLKELLKKYKEDNSETWKSILLAGGSVQHLDFLSTHEKNVFKTFGEIQQIEIILQAAMRTPYIDQSQSINLMIHPDAPAKDVSNLLIEAWKLGVKTLYYQRSTNPNQVLARELLSCVACEA